MMFNESPPNVLIVPNVSLVTFIVDWILSHWDCYLISVFMLDSACFIHFIWTASASDISFDTFLILYWLILSIRIYCFSQREKDLTGKILAYWIYQLSSTSKSYYLMRLFKTCQTHSPTKTWQWFRQDI